MPVGRDQMKAQEKTIGATPEMLLVKGLYRIDILVFLVQKCPEDLALEFQRKFGIRKTLGISLAKTIFGKPTQSKSGLLRVPVALTGPVHLHYAHSSTFQKSS